MAVMKKWLQRVLGTGILLVLGVASAQAQEF